jgi:hypothetical protein
MTFCLLLPGTAQAKHFHVFILAGQSNAVGSGTIGTYLSQPDVVNRYGRDLSQQTDVELFYRISLEGNCFFGDPAIVYDSGGQWIPLGPQQTSLNTEEQSCNPFYNDRTNATGFGPEISLGRYLADNIPHPVAIIKFAVGATQLGDPVQGWMPGAQLYDELISIIETATHALTTRGNTFEIRGVFWMQGESDATDRNSRQVYRRYEENLTQMIASLRERTNHPFLPFIMGEISPHSGSRAKYEYEVRDAKFQVAANDPFALLVNTRDLEKRPNDEIHYSSQGQLDLGQRFGEAYIYLSTLAPQQPDQVVISFDWRTESAGFHLASFFGSQQEGPLAGTGRLYYYPKTPYYSRMGDYPGALQLHLTHSDQTLVLERPLDDPRNPQQPGLDLRLAEEREDGSLLYQAFGRFALEQLMDSPLTAEIELSFELFGVQSECGQPSMKSGLLTLPAVECLTLEARVNPNHQVNTGANILMYSNWENSGNRAIEKSDLKFSNLRIESEVNVSN